jgi:ribosomal protein S18 acetylase RimI-like enzyme
VIDPIVRAASPRDAGPLAVLEAEARTAVAETRGGTRWLDEHAEVGERWVQAIEARSVFVAVLTDVAGEPDAELVVGYLVLDVDGPIAHVDQVYVTPEARQLGFGDALLASATESARQAGATYLEGHALPGDRETKNLYERAGVTARLITVSRPLSGPSTPEGASR